jgi:hypothetical protein
MTARLATRPVYGIKVDPLQVFARMMQDCLTEQTVAYWLRRAEWFDTCNSFLALQCRRHAWLLAEMDDGEVSEDVWNVLSEVAS